MTNQRIGAHQHFLSPRGMANVLGLLLIIHALTSLSLGLSTPSLQYQTLYNLLPASLTCFKKLEATHGYFQIPLDEEASRLTKFLLPSGRYHYLRAPMGLSSSSNEWCRHSDHVVEGFVQKDSRRHLNMGSDSFGS